ncbi:MAG: hypothetical protein N2749_05415 [Clostridia bacterium]|nr:hypothetical protein [Clostridia bacterium]
MRYALVIIYLILTISGLIFMKLGGNPGTIGLKNSTISMDMSLVSGLGFICYIASFLLFTRIVIMFDLSYIFPICAGVVQVATLIASYYVFKEKISMYGILGASLIIIGIIIMNIKVNNTVKDTSSINIESTQKQIKNM